MTACIDICFFLDLGLSFCFPQAGAMASSSGFASAYIKQKLSPKFKQEHVAVQAGLS
jgi:hypothetical protein